MVKPPILKKRGRQWPLRDATTTPSKVLEFKVKSFMFRVDKDKMVRDECPLFYCKKLCYFSSLKLLINLLRAYQVKILVLQIIDID